MKRLAVYLALIILTLLPQASFCQSDSMSTVSQISAGFNYGLTFPLGSFKKILHAKAGSGYNFNLFWDFSKRFGAAFSFERVHYGIDDVALARDLHPDFYIPDQVSRTYSNKLNRQGWNYTSLVGGITMTLPQPKSQTTIGLLFGMSFLGTQDNINFSYTINDTMNEVLGVPMAYCGFPLEMRVSESYALGKRLAVQMTATLQTMFTAYDYGTTLSENTAVPKDATFHYRTLYYDIPFSGAELQAGVVYHF